MRRFECVVVDRDGDLVEFSGDHGGNPFASVDEAVEACQHKLEHNSGGYLPWSIKDDTDGSPQRGTVTHTLNFFASPTGEGGGPTTSGLKAPTGKAPRRIKR